MHQNSRNLRIPQHVNNFKDRICIFGIDFNFVRNNHAPLTEIEISKAPCVIIGLSGQYNVSFIITFDNNRWWYHRRLKST